MHGQDELVDGIRDIAWFDASGELVSNDSWNNPKERRLVLRRAGRNGDGAVSILTAFFNATGEDRSSFACRRPAGRRACCSTAPSPTRPSATSSSDDLMIGAAQRRADLEQPQGPAAMTSFARDLPFGATLVDPDHTRFRLWAPGQHEVAVEVEGLGSVPMTRDAEGWFEAEAACGAGARYRYRLADGLAVPDPASRAQADDVHDPSLVVDPRAYRWRHPDWRGRQWHGDRALRAACRQPAAASPACRRRCPTWPSSASPPSS